MKKPHPIQAEREDIDEKMARQLLQMELGNKLIDIPSGERPYPRWLLPLTKALHEGKPLKEAIEICRKTLGEEA